MTSNSDRELAAHLIDKYRELIVLRYQYEDMNKRLALPPEVDKPVVDSVRGFFLESVYPEASERQRLEQAFSHLSAFLKHPTKIWRLLGNMASAVFKFGRQFPAALKAGYKALQSYLDAKNFEHELLVAAHEQGYTIPLSMEQFEWCLAQIPRKSAEGFMKEVLSMFESLTNVLLVEKTTLIMDSVIRKMEKYPQTYDDTEKEGIRIGIRILRHSREVFAPMSDHTKQLVVDNIRRNEMWFLDQIYDRKSPKPL